MIAASARDLRCAVRGLLARPVYALVSIATLMLVVGAGTAVLAVINATLVRPLPFPDGQRLVRLFTQPPGTTEVRQRNPLHALEFVRFRRELRTAAAVEGFWARERALGGDGETESVSGAQASAGAFALLGGVPVHGRTWIEDEDRVGARLVVLSHGLWQRRFGGDSGVIGRTVLLDREPYDVIGVMGRAFEPAYIPAELWTPLGLHDGNLPNPRSTYVQTVARLAPGATIAELDAEAVMAMEVIAREQPASHAGWKALAVDLREAQFGQQRAPLTVLLAAVVALALIACANLANLTLAHVLARRGELALRTAMGARRVDLLRLQAIETLVLAAAGGAAGVLAARWTLPVLLALDPATALILGAVPIDWRVLSATLALTLLVALFSGVLPVLRELRTDVARGLADGTRRAAGSRRDHRVGFTLVAAETGVAVLLLASSALLVNSFARAARTDPGFDPSGVVGAQLRLPSSGFPTEAARTMFTRQAADRLRAVPGVVDASTTLNLFVPGFTFQTLVHIEGRPTPDGQPHTVQFRRAGAGYFRTLRMPLLAGRSFDDGDALGSPRVAVVSRSFAERFWPGEDPVGRRIRRNTATLTVIGVVGDVSDVGFGQPPEATLYVSHAQESPAGVPVSLVVRAAGDPLALVPAIRAAIFSLDPALPIDKVTTLEAFLSASLGPERFRSTLLLVFGGLGLLLAAVGIYGVTARSVHERTREVGVRLALGADPVRIWCLVVRRAMAAVVLGLLCGSAAALAAGTLLVRLFPGLERAETWAPLPAVVALGLTALVAAALPARRALGVDPVLALRGE